MPKKKEQPKVFVVPVVHAIAYYAYVKAPDRKTAIDAALAADNDQLFGDEGCDFEDYDNYVDEKNVSEIDAVPAFVAVKDGPRWTLESI